MITAKEIFKLSKRDFENGAVVSEIYNTLKQYEADAKVHAAASDMLAALKGAQWLINKMAGWCDNDLDEFNEPGAIEAAIAKAKP